jgi:hypothetical protein
MRGSSPRMTLKFGRAHRAHVFSDSILKKPKLRAPYSFAGAGSARRKNSRAPLKKERARGTPESGAPASLRKARKPPTRTHGPPRLAAKERDDNLGRGHRPAVNNRKSAGSPASRVRCLRLAPHDPRWSRFQGSLARSRSSGPTHRSSRVLQRLAAGVPRYGADPKPLTARSGAPGPLQLEPPRRVYVWHPERGHRSPPRAS